MKRKILKAAAAVIALFLTGILLFFANAFMGNPVSRALAKRTAEKHLEEKYAGTDYEIESVGYDFKATRYYAHIISPASPDSSFTLYLGMNGKLITDTYADYVLSGLNTALRLDREYRAAADYVFDSPGFPFECEISYGDLEFTSMEYAANPDVKPYALITEELIRDGEYDIGALGAQAGKIVIYVNDTDLSAENAAKIMIKIRNLMDSAGVGFKEMDFMLWPPKPLEGSRTDEGIYILGFPYEDIYEEGMTDRVIKAWEETQAYFREQDEKYKESFPGKTGN